MFCLLANHCDASENKALKLLIENRSCNGCNLSKLNLGWYNLFKVDLSGADLSENYLVNVDLSNANLSSSGFKIIPLCVENISRFNPCP